AERRAQQRAVRQSRDDDAHQEHCAAIIGAASGASARAAAVDMQRLLVCAVGGVSISLLSVVSVLGQTAQQRQVTVETVYPRHVAPGRTTVLNIAVPGQDRVQAAEISPSAGVTVSGIKGNGSETEQAIGWWEITLDVAKDAAPGDRSVVLVM